MHGGDGRPQGCRIKNELLKSSNKNSALDEELNLFKQLTMATENVIPEHDPYKTYDRRRKGLAFRRLPD